jgi:2-keto-4-pentenoate hydratase
MLRTGPATAMPQAAALPRPLAAFLALVLSLAVVGAVLAAGVIGVGGGGQASAPVQVQPDNGFAVGDSVYTSFGAVAVEAVEKNKGLTA